MRPGHVRPEQRMLILDAWSRSGLPAKDFAPLVGVAPQTLYVWRARFREDGPAGLQGRVREKGESRLPEATKRAILLLKETHPDWGEDRIHAVLLRSDGFQASAGAIGRLLALRGWRVEETPTRPHADKKRRFERARPNQLWQSDLFTFVLKRTGRRVHLVAFMDDHSRFIVSFGLHASSSGALVREAFEAGIASFGAPEEVLTDQGPQYHTWRGKSAFAELCERRGIRQLVARAHHPQTLGKVERFWGTLWRECVEQAIFQDLEDARRRVGLFIDHYNFQRPHSGLAYLVPADRFFAAAAEVLSTLKARVAANAVELARNGTPRKSFYLTGRVGDQAISLHAEGERVVMTRQDGTREEVDLSATGRRMQSDAGTSPSLPESVATHGAPRDEEEGEEMPPGVSPLDEVIEDLGVLRAPRCEEATLDSTSTEDLAPTDLGDDDPWANEGWDDDDASAAGVLS